LLPYEISTVDAWDVLGGAKDEKSCTLSRIGQERDVPMPIEIERKFLVADDAWRGGREGQRFCQGYLASDAGVTVRVRRAGPKAYVTIKGQGDGSLVRPEFEYEIPVEEAEQMLLSLCRQPLIEKTRHEVGHAGHLWHVDEFGGENAGLVLAEVELNHPAEEVVLPSWVGEEVTSDPHYRNSALVAWPMGKESLARRRGSSSAPENERHGDEGADDDNRGNQSRNDADRD
jgi:adenylate cyclase